MIFILIFVLTFIFVITIFRLKDKWYNEDKNELEERILQLEKRLQKSIKDRDDELVNIYDNISINNDEIKEIQLRLQKLERKRKSDKNDNS